MLIRKIIILGLVGLYLYAVAFCIFMTDIIRLPAPLIFGLPLLVFMNGKLRAFGYFKEMALITLSLFLYYVVGMDDLKTFFAAFITIVVCAIYFDYFVALNKRRFNISVFVFFALLLFSMIILVGDHFAPSIVDPIRSILAGEQVQQSPSGIAVTQFNFGYQVVAFAAFVFVFVCTFKRNFLVKSIAFGLCLTFLYLGMNRSAFVCFTAAVFLFLLSYYRAKALLVIAASVIIGFAVYFYILKDDPDNKNNILAKNEAKSDDQYNRTDLVTENLKICADYPFGLIFYGKSWEDVTYRHPLFAFGLTSHNSYLMFLTFLGPFFGFGLLIAMYYRFMRMFRLLIKHSRLKDNALIVSLYFSFLAVCLNALSHNGWLLSVDGPTLFLYFCILQCEKIYPIQTEEIKAEAEEETALQMAY